MYPLINYLLIQYSKHTLRFDTLTIQYEACLKSTIWAACSRIPFYFTMSLYHMAKQPIRGCEIHTTDFADRACDDDLFSFIFKKSHENR